jgi:hypothetical protein
MVRNIILLIPTQRPIVSPQTRKSVSVGQMEQLSFTGLFVLYISPPAPLVRRKLKKLYANQMTTSMKLIMDIKDLAPLVI